MRTVSRTEVRVGIVVIVAMLLLFVFLRALRTRALWGAEREITVVFAELGESLPSGSAVKLAGVRIGSVNRLDLVSPAEVGGVPEDLASAPVVVALRCRINDEAELREGYRATVKSGFPLGEPHVEIRLGRPNATTPTQP